MSLGASTVEVLSGGGRQRASAAKVARTVVLLGVSPLGDAATVYRPGSKAAISTALDTGPLCEAAVFLARLGLPTIVVPINPSVVGAKGAVTQTGTGTGALAVSLAPHRTITVLCTLGGTLTNAKFKFSLDGGVTYGPEVTSGTATWAYPVPGTFATLSFAAATYVIDKTLTVSTNGTVTPGSGWVGTVTQVSSPIDRYDFLIEVVTGGLYSNGDVVLRISLDGGETTLPDMGVPVGGVVVVPGTGVVLTASATFVAEDTYAFLTVPPSYATQDLSDALDALLDDESMDAALIYPIGLPATTAGAITQGSTIQSFLEDAADLGLDWQGATDCPYVGDAVVSGGNAIADTADTDAVIRAAVLAATETKSVAFHVGTHKMTSGVNRRKLKRGYAQAVIDRFVDTDPRDDISEVARGALRIFKIGRDERTVTTTLDDVHVNVARTYRSRPGAFQCITSGGSGWKNMTADENYGDAGAVRALNVGLRALRAYGEGLLGKRPETNADGTIAEGIRRAWSTGADDTIRKSLGLKPGGQFVQPQASSASGEVLATSQLGTSPRRLELDYDIQSLGFVSDVHSRVRFSGTLNLEGQE